MKKFICVILSLLLLLSFSACSDLRTSEKQYKKDFLDLFDTACSVTASDKSQNDFNKNFSKVYDLLCEYARLYDVYNSYGDLINLKYINENAAESPVKVDKRIIELLVFGKKAYEISGGKVNIAMGAVLSVWHDARENANENPNNARLPDMNLLAEKARHTDINDLIIDEENSTVFFNDKEMSLDTGAVAKGFVCEKIYNYIADNNIWSSALINLGGNIKTIGYKNADEKTPFSIGIEDPGGNGYLSVVKAENGISVVTSGDYQRYFTVNGKRYCHIIDPQTLMPAEYVSSVSVICSDSALADALSTTLFNMSVANGKKLVESLENTEAVWMDKNGNIYYSSGYEEFEK
ncbi:MAG: FAD:protein FMN transferase [Clostridiales bacterium]|nr:FAD:protein FMN transferase [Clostridiales bacterium]